ncbi:MAG TPA: hydroxyacylglutathione hydrolase [Kofleriaceae bacterium]|jgi:hydroxyacylglutathione hydrolase|nr:hydroxyacylglutathione hydrolase [Kofleriaceae bacterium]
MRIVTVPCLADNYAYLVICESTGQAAVVDPSEAAPVLAAAAAEKVQLAAIWCTHHHHDHVGGNQELQAAHPELPVVGHASDRGRMPGQTLFVEHGDEVTLGDELRAHIIHNPGHTRGAITYHLAAHAAAFTGDTLFLAGCGRMFEGTAPEMQASLARLAALPPETRIYCGHEYTAANLRFAAAVEPDSDLVKNRADWVGQLRAQGKPSVGAPLSDELATNPFLRVDQPAVIAAARAHGAAGDDPAAVFGALRAWKDGFKA